MFKKALSFTDIHFGKKSDSERHNQDCLAFGTFVQIMVKKHDCDCIIIIGDWFDNQSRIGVNTLHHSTLFLEELNQLGIPIYVVVGNHDMYFKNNRSIHSLRWMKQFSNVVLVEEPTMVDRVMLLPYLVGSEFAWVPEQECDYVFGHLALPFFLLNQNLEMRDEGGLHADHFLHPRMVFSGHFHKRQCKVNKNNIPIWYIGNAFPMDFNDVGDRDRGCMILEYGQEPIFENWAGAPNYNRIKLSELLEMVEADTLMDHFNGWSVVECTDDLNIGAEEVIELKDSLQQHLREVIILQPPEELDITEGVEVEHAEDLDQMVVKSLRGFDAKESDIDPELLVNLFQGTHHVKTV